MNPSFVILGFTCINFQALAGFGLRSIKAFRLINPYAFRVQGVGFRIRFRVKKPQRLQRSPEVPSTLNPKPQKP